MSSINPYIHRPRNVMSDPGLSRSCRSFLVYLLKLGDPHGVEAPDFMDELRRHMSDEKIARLVREAQDNGYLHITSQTVDEGERFTYQVWKNSYRMEKRP